MTNIVFMGTPDFAVPILHQLLHDNYHVAAVVTQPDKPKGRKRELVPPPVKVEAERHGIPVLQPTKIREPEQYEQVLAFAPDLIVTAAFGQILPKALLDAPKYGCINVHASLLPELRGGAPIHYAIWQGKTKTGVTIMYMVERLDAGDMLAQVEVPIAETDTVGTLHDKLSAAGLNYYQKRSHFYWKETLRPFRKMRRKPRMRRTFAASRSGSIGRSPAKPFTTIFAPSIHGRSRIQRRMGTFGRFGGVKKCRRPVRRRRVRFWRSRKTVLSWPPAMRQPFASPNCSRPEKNGWRRANFCAAPAAAFRSA
ncbi:Methionyl-tRNA formyltransferase [Geobacillus sp. BCO2]|nr:Methionyl-tRNA formyltransferase [Geobacillus sp. BCO2]